MVDLVVPVTAPGATAADAQIKSVANAAGALANQNVRLQASAARVGTAMRAKASSVRLVDGGFSSLTKTGLKLTGTLASLGGIAGGVGGAFSRLAGLSGAFGPLGLAIGGVSLLLGEMGKGADSAEDKLKRVADIKEKLASAQKERQSLVEELGGEAEKGGKVPGLREALAAGVSRTQIASTIGPNINADQAASIEKALKEANISDDQRKEFRRGAGLIGTVGGDPVKTVQGLIQQTVDDSQRNHTSEFFGTRSGLSTKLDRLLDAAGIDPGTKEGQRIGQNFFNPNLQALDFGQQAAVKAEKDRINAPFTSAAQSAADELGRSFVPAAEKLTTAIGKLDTTISDLKSQAKKDSGNSQKSGWVWTGWFGEDH